MKSGSSASIGSGSHCGAALAVSASQEWSRPSCIGTSPPVMRATITFRMVGQFFSASSALVLSGTRRPPRRPSSAVSSSVLSQSWMRLARLSEEKPPKTTEWMAPMRAQASIATAASTTMGR